jgi:hypothetical protein
LGVSRAAALRVLAPLPEQIDFCTDLEVAEPEMAGDPPRRQVFVMEIRAVVLFR